jgi:hypothetical protein
MRFEELMLETDDHCSLECDGIQSDSVWTMFRWIALLPASV